MKHVTILIPTGNVNLSSVVGTLEILTGANEYWQKNGNNSRIKVSVAGVLAENTQKMAFILLILLM